MLFFFRVKRLLPQLNSGPFLRGRISYARGWKEESFANEESLYTAKRAVLQILIMALTYATGLELVCWVGTERNYFQ